MALQSSKHRFYAAAIYALVLSTVIESLPDTRVKGLTKSQRSTSGRRSTYAHGEDTIYDKARTSVEQWAATDQSLDPYIYESTSLPDNPKFYPSVGNGHLGHTVYRDSIFVNGIYSGELGWSHRARIPAYHSSNFSVQSGTSECTVGVWTHQLNLRTGTFTQTISFPGVNVITKVYAHQYYNRLLVTEVTLERKVGCGVCCDGDIEIRREDLGSAPSTDLELQPPVEYLRDGCPADKCWAQSGTIKEREVAEAPLTNVTIYVRNMPSSFTLAPTDTTLYHFYIVSIDQIASVAKDNFDAAMDTILSTFPESNLHAEHVQAFNNTWTKGTIDVQGDLHLAKVIHGCLYYLYTSLPAETTFKPNNQFSGLSPGGLPNGANNTDYQGHVFWDMETWMYPPILMFRPDLAKDMLSYRISRITPAFERAVQTGYQGARFPWESAFTGVEVTPDICPACRDNQQHITGDIAYAARQYVSSTWDLQWLQNPQADTVYTGFQFITEMARFWQSRPKLNEATGRYDIAGVMPPDEHQENVTNSIYTNVGASYAIHFADFAACLLGRTNTNPEWLEIAQKLAFTYNSAKQYHEEFEGYDKQVETNTTDIRGVKQADVVMLGFPFLWDMPSQVRTNDQLWYETVTHPNGPAMTWGIYSINWLDLGNYEKADEMFNKAYQSYAREPFKVWTEVQSGDGAVNFITGMGGFLQTIVFGYAGLRLDVTELRFNTARLPPGTTQLSLKNLNYLGAEFDVHINATMTTVAMITTGGRQFRLITSSDETLMTDGVVKSVTHQSFVLRSNPIPNCQISKPEIDVDYSAIKDQGNHITSSTTAVISLSAIALVAKLLSNY